MPVRMFENTWRVWLSAYAPVLLWIGLIFFLSSPQGASPETSRFVRPLIEFFFPNASAEVFEIAHSIVRKAAHLTEYAILAILAFRAARSSTWLMARRRYLLLPFLLVAAVAGLDEFNQSFEPSRTGTAWDSLLDSFGGATALLICWLIVRRRDRDAVAVDAAN